MQRTDFSFVLPESLIAQKPCAERTASRLLVLDRDSGKIADQQFSSIVNLLNEGDLLVMNDTRVIRARLFGHKETGGKVEILIERVLDDHHVLAQIKASKSPKAGTKIQFDQDYSATVTGRQDDLFEVKFDTTVWDLMEAIGHIPLPLISLVKIPSLMLSDIRPCLQKRKVRLLLRQPDYILIRIYWISLQKRVFNLLR
jgi:S-adenosylmethionine:tRNA ribosyltransferase-isomerase